ncbi:uncharacterized protein LY89DRAFT_696771 [Mollisia scopiformis]|uniref:Sexual development protein n=1 Tax=Mollisia scopiformis TaxID=149040 RepID=A0A194XAR2_MOLSC|nr:uncharacterized protein LY89DRAFT_696771 [Mollisia scopiformis]KUJ17266.1 hypothetical protein LY89DRAFT_696771 [Mollisia scopiformis]
MFSLATASIIGFSCLTAVSAAPFTYNNNPLGNNFPNPSPSQTTQIELQAHAAAHGPSPTTITSLEWVAFNELSEVAFFTELIANITNNVPGYIFDTEIDTRNYILTALTAVQAQEELHALNANLAVKKNTGGVILPCEYNFPVNNIEEAIEFASLFTDVVLGTLQDVVTLFGEDGDAGLIRGVASVIGQEGEQNGFYRNLLNKIPSALPFLTASTRAYAFSAVNQLFVVPGTCPNVTTTGTVGPFDIDLPVFDTLTVVTQNIQPKSQTLSFTFDLPAGGAKPEWKSDYSGLELVLINQQNAPVIESLTNVQLSSNLKTITFDALFPFNGTTFGNGLTLAVITPAGETFTDIDSIANVTIFGPGLIEVN